MSRSLKKGPYIDERLLEKMKKARPGEVIKTWERGAVISPEMIGFTFGVYNGREFVQVQVQEEMVGHKLGEFSPTTRFHRHGGRMQRELEASEAQKETAKIEAAAGKPEAVKPETPKK